MEHVFAYLYRCFSVFLFFIAVTMFFSMMKDVRQIERQVKHKMLNQHVIEVVVLNEEGD